MSPEIVVSHIRGISRTALWQAWKAVRRDAKQATYRDIIDHLDYDLDPDIWIRRLLRQIEAGSYEPATPIRQTLAKSAGFSRTLTRPSVPDLVLFRAIVDHLYARSKRREKPHVYFQVDRLEKAQREAEQQARDEMEYAEPGRRRFLAWLRYAQYRRQLILRRTHRFVVATDVTNFFDSILHGRLAEAFHPVAAPPGMLGLLFFLLERLSVRDAYGESPRIGLPVDEFDCSRRLAHMFLFSHDQRMCEIVGDDAYVRWMDDQNLGAPSRAQALHVVAEISRSLARLHLTANAAKTRILSLRDARRHYHLDFNQTLDAIDKMPHGSRSERVAKGLSLGVFWRKARVYEQQGEWEKILKRAYRLAGLARSKAFRSRAKRDLMRYPGLVQRVSDYMRVSGGGSAYLRFVESIWSDGEQVYADINLVLVESLLRLEVRAVTMPRVRRLASQILSGSWQWPGRDLCAATAPLLILRFGDRRSLPLLRGLLAKADELPEPVVRSVGVVLASCGDADLARLRRKAARLRRNLLAEIVLLVDRLKRDTAVQARYRQRLNARFDSVQGRAFVDMRALLTARLMALNTRGAFSQFLGQRRAEWTKGGVSAFDRRLQ